MIKEMIYKLNNAMYDAKIDFDVAIDLMKTVSNDIEWGVINCRIVFKAVDGKMHDAYVNF